MTATDTANEKLKSLRWAIILSAFLSIFKAFVGLLCTSQALLASALDSLMDTGISSGNYISAQKAQKPPDEDHAYGHEKIESLAAYTQGVVILIFAIFFAWHCFQRALQPGGVQHSGLAILAIIISCAVNLFVTIRLSLVEKKTHSLILKAETMHYFMDVLSYIAIFVALVLTSLTGWKGWDILGGLFVCLYVGYLAFEILIRASNELVDRSLQQSTLDELDTIIRNHDSNIIGYHELRTRKVGDKAFIDFHLVIRPTQTFRQVHEISDSLIKRLKERFPNADVTIHEDPEEGV